MRALVVDPDTVTTVRFADVGEPQPRPDQPVVEVRHVGVNFGEVLPGVWPAGHVQGHDASGVVAVPAADGSGPAAGTPVAIGFTPHAWAQRVAVDPGAVAPVPDGVPLADAAALPVAGVAALRVMRSRSLLGRRVLVTGAGGGVGRFAVQLAALAGASVTAVVGAPERGTGLTGLGADTVVVGFDEVPHGVDLVLDTVGGPGSARLWDLLAPHGTLYPVGNASGAATTFAAGALIEPGRPRTIGTLPADARVGPELATLLGLVAAGRLSAEVGWRGGWDRIDEAVAALRARRVAGKVVLDVG